MPKNILISIATALAVVGMAGSANADLVISKKKTSNVNCSAGVCNATAADAVLNIKDLTNMLATSDVHVFAEGVATDITVADPFSWTSRHILVLGANGSLNVKAQITVAGTSGLTINTNIAQTGGLFRLVGVGQISFWDTTSTLFINNTNYTLVNNLPDLIAAVAANPAGTYAFANDYNAAQDGNYSLSPIPTTLTGVVEGLGNAISNLTIYNATDTGEKIALFSQVGTGGLLSDVNLANVSMQANDAYLAPLVVTNNGTVAHSSASGAISGLADGLSESAGLIVENDGAITRSHAAVNLVDSAVWTGGLVANNQGAISLSDASGSVSTITGTAGGLVANSDGIITDSYAQGAVTGREAGGLAGSVSGQIQRCFATGAVQYSVTGPAKKTTNDRRGASRKVSGVTLGGFVGSASGVIDYSYATGSVTREETSHDEQGAVGSLIGLGSQGVTGAVILQSYALGKTQSHKRFLGGVIGFDAGLGKNPSYKAAFWNLDTTGIENPAEGAGNISDDKGLKGLSESNFRRASMRKFDPSIWAENPNINNGYPYLISNPPPPQ